MNGEKICLVLTRNPSLSPLYPERSERSKVLFRHVIEPAAVENGFRCVNIDPHEFGRQRDAEFFNLFESAEVFVVDGSAGSADFSYSLGVRHALTDKATIILADEEELPFDVEFPGGIFIIPRELDSGKLEQLRSSFAQRLREAEDEWRPYSPIKVWFESAPRVFFSYAHANRESVVAVDQWLRDHGFRVELDERDFIAGRDIRDEIMRCIERSGKVVFFYSAESKDRYYTKLEQRFVQEKEQKAHVQGNPKVLLVYFRLDETPLPLETSHRLAINAWNMSFQGACLELRRHLLEESAESTRVPLAQYASRPPWKRQV